MITFNLVENLIEKNKFAEFIFWFEWIIDLSNVKKRCKIIIFFENFWFCIIWFFKNDSATIENKKKSYDWNWEKSNS